MPTPKVTALSPAGSPINATATAAATRWGSLTASRVQCPASPMSASTTASSTAASPMLLSLSPASSAIKTPFDPLHPRTDSKTPTAGFVLGRKISSGSAELLGLEPLAVSYPLQRSNGLEGSESESVLWTKQSTMPEKDQSYGRTSLAQEEAELYSDILVNILQQKGENYFHSWFALCMTFCFVGLMTEEEATLERFKLESESLSWLSTLVPLCDTMDSVERSVSEFSCPPGLPSIKSFQSENNEPTIGSLSETNNYLCKYQSHENDIATYRNNEYYHPHHSSISRWEHSNNTSCTPCYEGNQGYSKESSYVMAASLPWNDCQCGNVGCCHSSCTTMNGECFTQHRYQLNDGYQNPHASETQKNIKNVIQQGSLTLSHGATDPLLLLTARSLLDSTIGTPRRAQSANLPPTSLSEQDNDRTTFFIAEVLKQISKSLNVTV